MSGVGGEGPPRRGRCFPVFGRSQRFVTVACASGVDATPLPSGRVRDERDRAGPIGGGRWVGAFGGERRGTGSFPFDCERGDIPTSAGVKALHFHGKRVSLCVCENETFPRCASFEPKVEGGDVCACVCTCVHMTWTLTHMLFYMVFEVHCELWWKH